MAVGSRWGVVQGTLRAHGCVVSVQQIPCVYTHIQVGVDATTAPLV